MIMKCDWMSSVGYTRLRFALCDILKHLLFKGNASNSSHQSVIHARRRELADVAWGSFRFEPPRGSVPSHFLSAWRYSGLGTLLILHPETVNQKPFIPVILVAAARLWTSSDGWTHRSPRALLIAPISWLYLGCCQLIPGSKVIWFKYTVVCLMQRWQDSVYFEQSFIGKGRKGLNTLEINII